VVLVGHSYGGAVITAEGSGNGKSADAYIRLVAVYAQEGDVIRLVHFQSTMLPGGTSATPNERREE
jgi:hypothetical protein